MFIVPHAMIMLMTLHPRLPPAMYPSLTILHSVSFLVLVRLTVIINARLRVLRLFSALLRRVPSSMDAFGESQSTRQ